MEENIFNLQNNNPRSGSTTVVYLNGINGNDNNNGSSIEYAVASLTKAYEIALSANSNALITDPTSHAVILLCGTTTVSSNFNTSKTYLHVGQMLLTSMYGQEDYRNSAKLQFSANGEQAIQLGGSTIIDNITLNRVSTSAYTIYSPGDLYIGDCVVNECNGSPTQKGTTTSGMQGKCIVRGGYYNDSFVGNISITVLSGTYWFVSGANATALGSITGNISISIGGSAWIATVVPGTQAAACTIGSSIINISNLAEVNTVTASGDYGNIPTSILHISGGTINNIIAHRSGKTGTFTTFSIYLHNNADITLLSSLPTSTNVNIDYSAQLALAVNDTLSVWNGCGALYYNGAWHRNGHTWGQDDCCTTCGVHRYTVFVDISAPLCGDGYSKDTAVDTLERAYTTLLSGNNNQVYSNSLSTGTIVLCSEITIEEYNFNGTGNITHAGTVTITSLYDNIDYRVSNDSKLSIGSITGNSQIRFQCGGPTIFDNITINRISRDSGSVPGSLTIYGANYLVMGTGVSTEQTNWSLVEPLTAAEAASTNLCAHMGYQVASPGNSIPAFRAAGAAGFWAIETDIRTTSDGVLVCCHDATIDSKYNGSGTIANMTYSQILQYKINTGNCVDHYSDNELRMPSFADYLEICSQYNALPFIEIKAASLSQVINEAKQYFDESDIIISSSSFLHLQQARAVSDDVFIHHIFSSESQINALAQMGNSGLSYNITADQLKISSWYLEAQRLITATHVAGVQVCLRAGDDISTVRLMKELGVDYIPTNTTTPASLLQTSYEPSSGGKIFLRGGYGYKSTDEDISIYVLGGQYDFVAASNAENETSGDYYVEIGNNAFVSRLVCGPTRQGNSAIQNSTVIISGNAIIHNIYIAGDYSNVTNTEINLNGGIVKSLSERRSSSIGLTYDFLLTLSDAGNLPEMTSVLHNCITGTKTLTIDGIQGKSMSFNAGWSNVNLINESSVTAVGEIPISISFYIEDGSTLVVPS